MNPSRRSARPLMVGFVVSILIVAALASPPLKGVWESSRAEAVATGPPTSVTQPPTSVTQPPTSVTQPPTVPPSSAAPPVTRPPRPTTTAPRSSTTDRSEQEAPAQASTTTTTLPQLLVPAENRPDAGDEDGNSSSTVSDSGGLAADTKVWLSVALLLVLGLAIAAMTLFYFFHTRPGDDPDGDDPDDDRIDDEGEESTFELSPERQLVGVGAGFAATRSAGDILAGDPPTVPVPVVPPATNDRFAEKATPGPTLPARGSDPPGKAETPEKSEPEKSEPEKSEPEKSEPERAESPEKSEPEKSEPEPGPDDPLGVLTRLLNDPPTEGGAP